MVQLTLNDLKPGELGRVAGCLGEGRILQRLCEMGFVPGVTLRVVRYAPLGDPIEVELYGYHVSLRRSEASLIRVERVSKPVPEAVPLARASEPACGFR